MCVSVKDTVSQKFGVFIFEYFTYCSSVVSSVVFID